MWYWQIIIKFKRCLKLKILYHGYVIMSVLCKYCCKTDVSSDLCGATCVGKTQRHLISKIAKHHGHFIRTNIILSGPLSTA